MLPTVNAEGRPVVPMTEEQNYTFDVKGWILIPGVLSAADCDEIKEHVGRVGDDPQSLDALDRDIWGQPTQMLLDHPVVVGVLNEVLAYEPTASDESYGFRVDTSGLNRRSCGQDRFNPHGGGGLFNFVGNSHTYQCVPGKMNTGLTRVVWELNPVGKEDGGTLFVSGSHKAAFDRPEGMEDRFHPLWERYECPAGSVLFFTEGITHSGDEWRNSEWDRLAIFNLYNTVGHKFSGKPGPTKEQVEAMPPLRQSLFRGVWCWIGADEHNRAYDRETNVQLQTL